MARDQSGSHKMSGGASGAAQHLVSRA